MIISSDNLEVTAGLQQPTFIEIEPTGVTDITGEFKMYPVPTRDLVTINGTNFNEAATIVGLYDIEGRRMEVRTECCQNTMSLDLGRLSSGIYYLTIINDI